MCVKQRSLGRGRYEITRILVALVATSYILVAHSQTPDRPMLAARAKTRDRGMIESRPLDGFHLRRLEDEPLRSRRDFAPRQFRDLYPAPKSTTPTRNGWTPSPSRLDSSFEPRTVTATPNRIDEAVRRQLHQPPIVNPSRIFRGVGHRLPKLELPATIRTPAPADHETSPGSSGGSFANDANPRILGSDPNEMSLALERLDEQIRAAETLLSETPGATLPGVTAQLLRFHDGRIRYDGYTPLSELRAPERLEAAAHLPRLIRKAIAAQPEMIKQTNTATDAIEHAIAESRGSIWVHE
jgi:hypothetical protein